MWVGGKGGVFVGKVASDGGVFRGVGDVRVGCDLFPSWAFAAWGGGYLRCR